MLSVVRSIDVCEKLLCAYTTWARLEGLPMPVTDPRGLECIQYTRLHWLRDHDEARDTHIAVERCGREIVWQSVTPETATTVVFESVSPSMTRITMEFALTDDSRFGSDCRWALRAAEAELQASLESVARQPGTSPQPGE